MQREERSRNALRAAVALEHVADGFEYLRRAAISWSMAITALLGPDDEVTP